MSQPKACPSHKKRTKFHARQVPRLASSRAPAVALGVVRLTLTNIHLHAAKYSMRIAPPSCCYKHRDSTREDEQAVQGLQSAAESGFEIAHFDSDSPSHLVEAELVTPCSTNPCASCCSAVSSPLPFARALLCEAGCADCEHHASIWVSPFVNQ